MPEEEDVHCFQQRILSCTSFSLVLLLLLDYLYQGPLLRAQNLFFFPSKFSHQNSSLIFQHYIRPKKTRRKSKKKDARRHLFEIRSEERRVGKECRSGWWADDEKKKRNGESRGRGGGERARRKAQTRLTQRTSSG